MAKIGIPNCSRERRGGEQSAPALPPPPPPAHPARYLRCSGHWQPGCVITRVHQFWQWYFQDVDTLIVIATSHDQLRQARPDQWSEWSPSHPAPHTALLLRCTGARVKMISSSRVTAWQQWPRDQTCHIARYRRTVSWKGCDFMSNHHLSTFTLVYYKCNAHAQPPAKPNLQGCTTWTQFTVTV